MKRNSSIPCCRRSWERHSVICRSIGNLPENSLSCPWNPNNIAILTCARIKYKLLLDPTYFYWVKWKLFATRRWDTHWLSSAISLKRAHSTTLNVHCWETSRDRQTLTLQNFRRISLTCSNSLHVFVQALTLFQYFLKIFLLVHNSTQFCKITTIIINHELNFWS